MHVVLLVEVALRKRGEDSQTGEKRTPAGGDVTEVVTVRGSAVSEGASAGDREKVCQRNSLSMEDQTRQKGSF